jgi:hypothetical protein
MKILNIKMEPLSFWYSFLKVFNDPILIQAQKEFCRKYLNIDKLDDKNIYDVIKSKLLVDYKIIDLSNNYDYTCPISNINTCNEGGYAYPMHMLGDIECNPKCVLSKDEYELVKNYCIPCPICDEMIDSNKLIEVPKINTENININEYYKNKCVYVTKELLNSLDYKKIIPMNKCDLTHEQYIIDFPHLKNPLNTAFPIIKTQEKFNKIVYEKYPYLKLPWKRAVILGGFSISIILEQKVRDFDIIFYGENCYDIFVDILQKLVLNLKQTYNEQIIKCLKSSKEQFNVFEVDIIEDPNNCYDNDILITDIIDKNYKEDGIKLLHRFQFILSKNNSLEDIFNKVDFYPSMIAWDGETTWMTQRTAYAYKYMLNEIEEDNYNDIFSYRLAKYYNKVFCIGLDKLDIDKLPQKFTIEEFTCEIIKIDKKCVYINYISEYNDKLQATNDIVLKSQYEDSINSLRKKKEDLLNNKPVYDYLFGAGEILFNYYDLQDKIQSGNQVGVSKVMKAKPGSVLAALQKGDHLQQEQKSAPAQKEREGREVLLEKYLQKVDPEHAKAAITSFEDPHGMCEMCDKEMTFSNNEALFFCDSCGHQEFVLIDSDKPSYKDPPREVTYYAYKRINHFNEWLAQFQAKESTEIPEDVFQAILEELKKERITNAESIKPGKVREILKKLKCTNFYEHVPYILNRINGKNAPVMSREVEEKLRFMFKEIQGSFVKHCPKTRSNFLSYSYVLYKFCELLELDNYLQCFPLLKNRDKLYNQDKIWQLICKDLSWEFIRSI